MKKIYLTVFCIFLIILETNTSSAAENKIAIYYYDRAPYRIRVSNHNASGILVDITKLAFQKARINFIFRDRPFKRAMIELKNPNTIGCIPGIYKTPEREEVYLYTNKAILQEKPMAIVINKKDTNSLPINPTIKELFTSKLIMGVYSGFSYGKWLDNKIDEYKPTTSVVTFSKKQGTTTSANIIEMISINRINYTLMAPIEARWLLKTINDLKDKVDLLAIKNTPDANSRYLVCSKAIGNDNLERINKAISEIIDSDEYTKIINKYR